MAKLVLGNDKTVVTPAIVRDVAPTYYIEKGLYDGAYSNNTANVADFSGVTKLDFYALAYAYADFKSNTSPTPNRFVAFNNVDIDLGNVTSMEEHALDYAFYNRRGINSVKLGAPNSELRLSSYIFAKTYMNSAILGCSVLGVNARGIFNSSGIKTCSMNYLTTIEYGGAQGMFQDSALQSANMPELLSITSTTSYKSAEYMFGGAVLMTSLSAPKLTTIGSYSANNFCRACSILTDIDLRSLETIGAGNSNNYTCQEWFSYCTSLEEVRFPSLKTIGVYAFIASFAYDTALKALWFYAIDTSTVPGNYCMKNMLAGVTGCTIHFPKALDGVWTNTSIFGGTNTVVLFDLITSLTGADSNTYTRSEKNSTATATAWLYNDTLYYTSGVSNYAAGVNEPSVGGTIYSDAACTTAVTTISSIA